MELIQLPRAMRNRGLKGWPEVYRVSKHEESPPAGISYVIAEKEDFALIFRIMVPLLMKQHPYLNWQEVYSALTGTQYVPQRVYATMPEDPGTGHIYGAPAEGRCDVTLEALAGDNATYVDIDVLETIGMIPVFMTDIREAITANVTNGFRWQDGYNKKTGVCSGSQVETPQDRSLIVLDISSSIPDGVSAGMLTLIKTMTDIVNADLIITASRSLFFTRDEARMMDINAVRDSMPRGNESRMFCEILRTHDMNYKNVITFGDSDSPEVEMLPQKLTIDRWYSFFCMARDTYGRSSEHGVGYGRWVKLNVPNVTIIHNTDWARFFNR